MKGGEGRRSPLSGPLKGLAEKFSLDAIRQRQQAEKSIRELQVRVQSEPRKKRKIVRVERPNAKTVAKRRAKAKGIVRPNKTKRARYLKAQRRRIAR